MKKAEQQNQRQSHCLHQRIRLWMEDVPTARTAGRHGIEGHGKD